MILLSSTMTIDLKEIETLRKWASYMPDWFVSHLDQEEYDLRYKKDQMILETIHTLYELIKKSTGKELDLNSTRFSLGTISFEDRERIRSLLSDIPSLDIKTYAELKLSPDENAYCVFSRKKYCNKGTSERDFFLQSYMDYLSLNEREEALKKIVIKQIHSAEKRMHGVEQREKNQWSSNRVRRKKNF